MEEEIQRGRKLVNRLEALQFCFFDGRPTWTNIELKDLNLYMAYTYFGPPEIDDANDVITDILNYYKDDEIKCISNLIKTIQKNFIDPNVSKIEVGFTMTHSICKNKCDICQNFPEQDIHKWYLLRIKLRSNKVIYVDLYHDRIYKNWNDYIENNSLPKGYMFFPESGYYEEKNYLMQNITPSSRPKELVLKSIDIVGGTTNFISGTLICGAIIFPVMAPVLIPAGIASTSSSLWDVGRQITKLKDLSDHSQSLSSTEANKVWLDLGIASLGVITGPLNVIVSKMSKVTESLLMTSKYGKALIWAQSSTCLIQCSMEVIRFTRNIMSNNFGWKDLMTLRLDLFVVVGFLLPLQYVKELVEVALASISFSPLYRQIEKFSYCLSGVFWKGVYFIKPHFFELIDKITKFTKDNLTADKLLCAYQRFRKFMEFYIKGINKLTDEDFLEHIVDDVLQEIPPGLDTSQAKRILIDEEMQMFLNELNALRNRSLIKFCVLRLIKHAKRLLSKYEEAKNACVHVENYDANEFEKEFCKAYNLKKCCTSQYLLNGIQTFRQDISTFLDDFNRFNAEPENLYNDFLVANVVKNVSQFLNAYIMTAPNNVLDQDTSVRFAQIIDSTTHEYNDYKYMQFEPDLSVLFSVSNYSIKLVFFSIDNTTSTPSIHISFYKDHGGSTNRLEFRPNGII